jgi:hypothetical protein
MANKDFEKINMQYTVNIIAELYSHKKIQDFVPALNKSKNNKKSTSETYDIGYMFINEEYSHIPGKESLESILKKTIHANVPSHTELTPNGIMRDELKKGIDILRSHINNISANNKNGNLDAELEKRRKELIILEKKYEECLEKGNFEVVTNYKDIAYQALKLLSSASNDLKYRKENRIRTITDTEKKARELRELIHQKFGLEFDRRERWQIEKDNKEYEYKTPEEKEREEKEKEQYEKRYNTQRNSSRDYYKNFGGSNQGFNDRRQNGYKPISKYVPPHMRNTEDINENPKQYVPPHKKKQEQEQKKNKFPTLGNLEEDSNPISKFPTLGNLEEDSNNVPTHGNGAWEKKLDFTNKKENQKDTIKETKETKKVIPKQNINNNNKNKYEDEDKCGWNLDE